MAIFSISNTMAGTEQNLTSAYKSIVSLNAATGTATLKRAWIYEMEVGIDTGPASTDGPIIYQWSRMTAAGTGTSATPAPLDAADPATAAMAGIVNYTVEPTVTSASELLTLALNQRNSQRWIARDNRSALIVPAVNLAGIVARAKSPTSGSYGGTVIVSQHFEE